MEDFEEDFRTTKVRIGILDISVTIDVKNTGFDNFCDTVHEIYPDMSEKDIFRVAVTYMTKNGFKESFDDIPVSSELFFDFLGREYDNMINFADLSALQRDFKTAELTYNQAIEKDIGRGENTYLHFLLACLYCRRFAEFDYYMEAKTIPLSQDGLLRSIYNWSLSLDKSQDEFTGILRLYDKYIPDDNMLLSFLSGIKSEAL